MSFLSGCHSTETLGRGLDLVRSTRWPVSAILSCSAWSRNYRTLDPKLDSVTPAHASQRPKICPQELKQEIANQDEPLSEATLQELDDDELQILFWAQAG